MGPNDTPPVACSLTGADHTDQVRRWRELLAGATPERTPGGGVRVRLDVARLPELGALVVAELGCCPFFTFTLTATHAGLQLDADAPDEGRPLLDELFAGADESTACGGS